MTFIMEHMLNSTFSKGAVINIDEKTVPVQIEGDKEQILKFREDLEKALTIKFGNPVIRLTEFEEQPALEIPDLIRSSQALMVGQLEKGIRVQLDILGALNKLPDELAKRLKKQKINLNLQFPYFSFSNRDIDRTLQLQCRNLILFLNLYFLFWFLTPI